MRSAKVEGTIVASTISKRLVHGTSAAELRIRDSYVARLVAEREGDVIVMGLEEGQVVDGKYVIKGLIASGGMADVYLGINKRIGKNVAVKVLHRDLAGDATVIARFEREARVVALIQSAHVADVVDLGELPTGERFIVMEYLEGESLAARLGREETLDEPALANIALQILEALSAAHAAGVVHRDLKPENVLLTRRDKNEVVKLVDFGVSKLASSEPSLRSTMSGIVLGTPLYMSPEQARGFNDALDHRTDLYALGVILYEAVSGVTPFAAEDLNDLLLRVANEEAPPLESRAEHVSPELLAIVEKAMAKNPSARYASADEMREAVLVWQDAVGLPARPSFARTSLTAVAPVEVRRQFMPRWLVVPTAVALVAVTIGSLTWRRSPLPEPSPTISTTVEPAEPKHVSIASKQEVIEPDAASITPAPPPPTAEPAPRGAARPVATRAVPKKEVKQERPSAKVDAEAAVSSATAIPAGTAEPAKEEMREQDVRTD